MTTSSNSITIVVGYQQVAIGTIQIPEITWVTTTIEETIGTELVDIGDRFFTMSVILEQTGYYNPNAPEGSKFKELFIEGVDYFNANDRPGGGVNPDLIIPWAAYGVNDTMTSDYRNLVVYRAFSQLNDAQRSAVLGHLGYKPLFNFTYTNALVHETRGVNDPTETPWTPAWASNALKIYSVDVDGWRDRYIQMPEGANEDVLRVEFFGETQYLINDTTRDGLNGNGTWMDGATYAGYNGLKGEFVGRFQDDSSTTFVQDLSTFTGNSGPTSTRNAQTGSTFNMSFVSEFSWFFKISDLTRDYDASGARWDVNYNASSGDRYFDMTDRSGLTSVQRDPNWVWETPGEVVGTDNYTGGRDTNTILATPGFISTINSGTAFNTQSLNLTGSLSYNVQSGHYEIWDQVMQLYVDDDDGSTSVLGEEEDLYRDGPPNETGPNLWISLNPNNGSFQSYMGSQSNLESIADGGDINNDGDNYSSPSGWATISNQNYWLNNFTRAELQVDYLAGDEAVGGGGDDYVTRIRV